MDSKKAGLEEPSRESDKAGIAYPGVDCLGGDCLGVDCLGVDCLGGCERPCTVAYQCDGKAGYLFGDIDPRRDLDALIAFAAQYVQSGDGWTNAGQRPPTLYDKTLARIPGGLTLSARAREGGR